MTLQTATTAKTATDAVTIPDGAIISTLIATDINANIIAAITRKEYALLYEVDGEMDSGILKAVQSDDTLVDLAELIEAIGLKGHRCVCRTRTLTSGIIRININIGWG